jgi:cell division protein FtsB
MAKDFNDLTASMVDSMQRTVEHLKQMVDDLHAENKRLREVNASLEKQITRMVDGVDGMAAAMGLTNVR